MRTPHQRHPVGRSLNQRARSVHGRDHGHVTAEPPRIQVLARRWKYAAPPWRLYEALVDERDRWLEPWDDELRPDVAEAMREQRVVLAPWVDREIDDAEVLIGRDDYGTQLIVLLHADHELGADRRREVRYRLGTLFGEALRGWVDGW